MLLDEMNMVLKERSEQQDELIAEVMRVGDEVRTSFGFVKRVCLQHDQPLLQVHVVHITHSVYHWPKFRRPVGKERR